MTIKITTGRRLQTDEKKQLLASLEARAQQAARRGLLKTAKSWRETAKK
jgi:hypothetical protein